MKDIRSILDSYESISLQEADAFSLKDRRDIKFIFNSKLLPEILNDAQKNYKLMLVIDNPQALYKTLYFDTDELSLYHAHHNGKKNRYKVRYRKYLDTGDSFLEVKFKSNKGNTIKKRIRQDDIFQIIPDESNPFIEEYTPFKSNELKALFYSSFIRTTLIHKQNMERVTIDIELKYFKDNFEKSFNQIAIAEVKTERFSKSSDFIKILKSRHIHSSSISKYCTGTALFIPSIKQNKFKSRFLKLNKIANDS